MLRHAFAEDVSIDQAQLTADCRQHSGSQLDRTFHRRFFSIIDRLRADSRREDNAIHRANNQLKNQTSTRR